MKQVHRTFVMALFMCFLTLLTHGQDTLRAYLSPADTSETLEIGRILAYDPVYPLLLFERRDSVFLAQKGGWAWVFWHLPQRSRFSTSYSLERRDINGDHEDEILLWWEQRTGHSGWNGGNSNEEKGVQAWTLSGPDCIIDLTYSMVTEIWWEEHEEAPEEGNEADTLTLTDSGSEMYGYTYQLQFLENGTLRLDSLEVFEEEETPDAAMGTYRFENGRFVLKE